MTTTFDDVVAALAPPNPVSDRMRAIFGLKGLATAPAVAALERALRSDPSVLVRHEVAYVLGQMRAAAALPTLSDVLRDPREDVMVRHEAAEALGAIGDRAALPLLERYAADAAAAREIRETCLLAVRRLHLLHPSAGAAGGAAAGPGAFGSVDPAPPASSHGPRPAAPAVADWRAVLCDPARDLFERYRALFALRDAGGDDAVAALCAALDAEKASALFRHEVAFVLGQMAPRAAVEPLARVLRAPAESPMVRHEAAEALGAIGTPEAEQVLRQFRADEADVVRESVEVALDISEHVASDDMHYAVTMGVDPAKATAPAAPVHPVKPQV